MTWYGRKTPDGSFDDDRERLPDFSVVDDKVQMACTQLAEDGYRVVHMIGLKSGFGSISVDQGLSYSYASVRRA